MFARFSLAILLAVVAAASRPATRGGAHDLLAVGVRVEETRDGRASERILLSAVDGEALAVYDAILDSPARRSLLQGTTVHLAGGDAVEGRKILSLNFYGIRTRAGRAMIQFDGTLVPGKPWRLACELAETPGAVTASAAQVLLESPDANAFSDALAALSVVRPDAASAAAQAVALAPPSGTEPYSVRKAVATNALIRLGGAKAFPETFRKLAQSTDPIVRMLAK